MNTFDDMVVDIPPMEEVKKKLIDKGKKDLANILDELSKNIGYAHAYEGIAPSSNLQNKIRAIVKEAYQ